jgi:hypothetical protein
MAKKFKKLPPQKQLLALNKIENLVNGESDSELKSLFQSVHDFFADIAESEENSPPSEAGYDEVLSQRQTEITSDLEKMLKT